MVKGIEHKLIFSIGLILLTSLYSFTGITHIPYVPFFAFILSVTGFFTIKRFKADLFINLVNNWNVFFFLTASLLLMLIPLLANGAEIKINDFVRVLSYCLFFSWSFFLYSDKESMRRFLYRICIWSLLILFAEAILFLVQPLLLNFMLGKETLRVSEMTGSLGDRNSFANAMVFLLAIILHTLPSFKAGIKWPFLVLLIGATVFFVEKSGSRAALLMIFLLLIIQGFNKITRKGWLYLIIGGIIGGFLLLLSLPALKEYALQNPGSGIARLFFTDSNPKSIASNVERANSILAGIDFILHNYVVFGPGSFVFESEWWTFTNNASHFPHNVFIFIWCQYGLLSLVYFYFLYIAIRRGLRVRLYAILALYSIQFIFSPNAFYYVYAFLIMFFIDVNFFLLNPPLGAVGIAGEGKIKED